MHCSILTDLFWPVLAYVTPLREAILSPILVHSQAANIDGVTCVLNFESPCLSNDARAFIVFNF